jgi:hypothetical protein
MVEFNCNKSINTKTKFNNKFPIFYEVKKWCKDNKIKIITWREISPTRFAFVFPNDAIAIQVKLVWG